MKLNNSTVVVTGGSSGIGAAIVNGALQRGHQVIYNGTRTISTPPQGSHYFAGSVADPQAMKDFAQFALKQFHGKFGPTLVVGNAGISARGDKEAVARMNAINFPGVENLFNAFRPYLDETDRFVGVSSVVAAENSPLPGDEAYFETKKQILEFTLGLRGRMDVSCAPFVLAPGAVDTPMTSEEMVFAVLAIGLACYVANPQNINSSLRSGLIACLGNAQLGETPSDVLRTVIGAELSDSEAYKHAERAMQKSPNLDGIAVRSLMSALTPSSRNTKAGAKQIQRKLINTLKTVDVVITPELVAARLLDQFESGQDPIGGVLKVYSERGEDWATKLVVG